MRSNRSITVRIILLFLLVVSLVGLSSRMQADTGTCGGASLTLPFTDVAVSNIFFCSIAQAYFSGLTSGTTATTYSPQDPVTREQMAAFTTRTLNQSLRRGSRRAALGRWETTGPLLVKRSIIAGRITGVASDGHTIWVSTSDNRVTRYIATDFIEGYIGVTAPRSLIAIGGFVFIVGGTSPGLLYRLDPLKDPDFDPVVPLLSASLGDDPQGISSDGNFIWTANLSGSVSRVDPTTGVSTNISTGFVQPFGILYDGANIWVTDQGDWTLKKLNSDGEIIQIVPTGRLPGQPVFDGTNIWVPNRGSDSITVVRAATGAVLATLTGNGLATPYQAAFDGERILVTNNHILASSVSLWNAASLTPIGSVPVGPRVEPTVACSDGINFWIGSERGLSRF
ncbi:MAG TPA: S-layer homology domain-containing protein [Blastocatellia bacterium]|nr:S-layer homology domain-containing protein [Blastocatellia bacterium]